MLRIMGRTWGLILLLGALGGLLGYGIDLALTTAGWALVGASLGLCGGAMFAGWLATESAPATGGAPAGAPPPASKPPTPPPTGAATE
jgi:hypothetical protein